LTIHIDYNFIRVLVNNDIFNVIFLLSLIALTMYNINIGFIWILIYLIIRQRYLDILSRYQNVTFNANTPESPCGKSNHEQCLHNAFNKPDSPSGLTLKDARINCCNDTFDYRINNQNNPSSYSDAVSAMATLTSPSPKCKCNPNAPKVTNPASCVAQSAKDDKDICIDKCIGTSTTNSADDLKSRCKTSCCIKEYRDCIKDSTPSACNGLMNKNNTFFCDCPDEITQQVCAESNDLPCVKAGLASSTCLTIDGIVSLCNDSAFLDHFNDQEKINNNPRLSFYNTIQYHSGLNANK
jgi:hypothetical protein